MSGITELRETIAEGMRVNPNPYLRAQLEKIVDRLAVLEEQRIRNQIRMDEEYEKLEAAYQALFLENNQLRKELKESRRWIPLGTISGGRTVSFQPRALV